MEVVGPLIGALVALAIIGGVIYALTRGVGNITFGSALAVYFALMIAISTLVIAGGAASLGKAGIAEVAGRDFSYNVLRYDSFGPRPPGAAGPPAPRRDESFSDRAQREDVADGITFVVIGAIILALHLQIKHILAPRLDPGHRRNIDRALLLGMTLVSGIGLLTSSGIGLSQLLRRTILETDLPEFESPPQPGQALAWAAVWLVLWVWFGARLWREFAVDRDREAS